MLKISRGVEHDPEAEPHGESYRDFDLKNRLVDANRLVEPDQKPLCPKNENAGHSFSDQPMTKTQHSWVDIFNYTRS